MRSNRGELQCEDDMKASQATIPERLMAENLNSIVFNSPSKYNS